MSDVSQAPEPASAEPTAQGTPPRARWRRVLGALFRGLMWLLAGVVAMLVLLFLPSYLGWGFLLEIPVLLAFGWIVFPYQTLPQVEFKLWLFVEAGVLLVLLAVGAHSFLAWLHAGVRAGSGWPKRWTAALLAAVLLVVTGGIGTVGMVNQLAGLFTDPEPIVRSDWAVRLLSSNAFNAAVPVLASVAEHHAAHGRFPDSNAAAGFKQREGAAGPVVKSLSIGKGGVVTIAFNDTEHRLAGHWLRLVPRLQDERVRWSCEPSPGLAPKDLPGYCRREHRLRVPQPVPRDGGGPEAGQRR